jgi:acyl carrier protein
VTTTKFKLKINEGGVSTKLYDEVSQLIYRTVEEESPELSRNLGATLEQSGSFMESLQVDSLLALEIVSRIEKRFGIQFQEEDFAHFDTMENIVNLVDRKIREKDSPSEGKRKGKEKISPTSSKIEAKKTPSPKRKVKKKITSKIKPSKTQKSPKLSKKRTAKKR